MLGLFCECEDSPKCPVATEMRDKVHGYRLVFAQVKAPGRVRTGSSKLLARVQTVSYGSGKVFALKLM